MLESIEFDDAELAVMLDLAKERSRALGHRRRLRRSVTGAAVLVLIIGTAGAFVLRPQSGGESRHQATRAGSHQTSPAWRLVGDVTQPSWQVQPALSGSGLGYGLVCPTVTTCYVEEQDTSPTSGLGLTSIEVTDDGGSAWQQSALPAGDWASTTLDCFDADTCAAGGVDSAGDDVYLTTDDGGQTWTSLPGPSNLPSSLQLLTVSCSTEQSCVAMGDVPGADASSAQTYYVLKTADGGESWSDSALPADFVPAEAKCFAGGGCTVVGAEGLSPAGPLVQGAALSSADGGQTWVAATLPDEAGPLSAVSCSDQTDCVAVTAQAASEVDTSQVLVTADGGQSWTLAPAVGLPASRVFAITCPTSSYCWASGTQLPAGSAAVTVFAAQGVLATTNDEGQTWQTAQLPPDLGVVTRVACPSTTSCFALAWQQGTSQQGQFVLLSYGSSET